MFTRNNNPGKSQDPRVMTPLQVTPLPPINRAAFAAHNPAPLSLSSAPSIPVPAASPMINVTSALSGASVIGSDLTILGRDITIISQGLLQIDGEVQGNLHGREIVVGEHARVSGTVTADSVIVRGQVHGTVRGQRVALQTNALVSGEIHHQTLSIEQGATFEGRVRRAKDVAELAPTLDPARVNGELERARDTATTETPA